MCRSWKVYREKCKNLETWTFFFLFFAVLNYCTLTALAIVPSVLDWQHGRYRQQIVSVGCILICIIIFQVVHTWYGIFHDNVYEIYATVVSQVFISVIGILQVLFQDGKFEIYDYVELSYCIFFLFIYLAFAYPLHKEYSWTFYKMAGTDPDFRRRFRSYLRFQVVLKFHMMILFVNGLVMGFAQAYWPWTAAIDAAYLLLGTVFFVTGRFGAKKESPPLVICFWFLFTGILYIVGHSLYFVIENKLVPFSEIDWKKIITSEDISFLAMYFASVLILLVLTLLLLILSIRVYLNFGLGLVDLQASILRSQQHGYTIQSLLRDHNPRITNDEDDAIDAILKNTMRQKAGDDNIQTRYDRDQITFS